MTALGARLDRLEAVHRRPSSALSAAEQADIKERMRRLLGLVPRSSDREVIFAEMLRRIDSGLATNEEIERVGGGNVELLRVIVKLHERFK